MTSDRISYRQTRKNIVIFIDCVPHLVLPRRNFLFQSWLQTVPVDDSWREGRKYCIEYYLKEGHVVLSEYHSKDMWVDILNYLNKEVL